MFNYSILLHRLDLRHIYCAARALTRSQRKIGMALGVASTIWFCPPQAKATPLQDPPVLEAAGNSLDVLMVARAQRLPFAGQPDGYAYEICKKPLDLEARRCPVPDQQVDLHKCPTVDDPIVSPYGGSRLQLRLGQTLHVRLVNCLPPAINAKHAAGDSLLTANPTNLHTHGLIVEPRRADDADDPFGDYVFVVDLPPGTKPPAPGLSMPGLSMPGMAPGSDHARAFDFRSEVVDYEIPIAQNHPPGLFWFHPHIHGLSLNQISGGLAGIITLGDVHAYACDHGSHCAPGDLKPYVRHLILKDTQITSDFGVRFQENPAMCATPDAENTNIADCVGLGTTFGTTSDGNDGRWEFTVNGQSNPEVDIHREGEIWRVANASGSASYNLRLGPAATPVIFQVLAIDGVSLVSPSGLSQSQARAVFGGRIKLAVCPGASTSTPSPSETVGPVSVCATGLRLMPSARAEIYIPADAATGTVVFETEHRCTGKDGDDWPSIVLATVRFPERAAPSPLLAVTPSATQAFAAGGVFQGPAKTRLAKGTAPVAVTALAVEPANDTLRTRAKTLRPAARLDCQPMPEGQARQILFGLPTNPNNFGLGYRPHIPVSDHSPPHTADDGRIVEFDHAAPPTVCIELGSDGKAVTETWMLVNLAGEDHNFHIHQTRFSVLSTTGDSGETTIPHDVGGTPVLLDNVPLPHANGDKCDGTVGPWMAGTCTPSFVTVSIPFHEVGDFVYHCHILEHEDGGMMAKISVVPHRNGIFDPR